MKVCNDPECSTPCVGRWCVDHTRSRQSEVRLRYGRNAYSSDWSRLSVRFRRRYPVCQCADEECRCGGSCDRASQEVDHVVPLAYWNDARAANDLANLQALCKSCHSSKTRRKDHTRPPQE